MPPGHQLLLLSRMASETLGGYDVTVAVPDIVLAHPDHLDRGAVHGLSSFDRCNLPVRNGQQESCDSVGQHFPLPHLTRRRCSHNSDVFFGTGLWLLTPSWEEMRATTLDAIAATADRPAPADPIAATADQPTPLTTIPEDSLVPSLKEVEPRLIVSTLVDLTALLAASARPAATPSNWHETPARNVLRGQQYDHLLRMDANFRRYRMNKECGPISDPRLRLNCLLSFSLTSR